MIILAIDFGLKKVGIAISGGVLAQPLEVIRYEEVDVLWERIKEICVKEKVEKIIVGVSEGQMGEKTREFIRAAEISVPIEGVDETLSTQEAQRLSLEAGMRRSKRKEMEDAMAAAILLQNYLEAY